ncbi:MAG TPA: glycine betaine ABC transporter substrate-binding protein [Candidatus Dormibacteraeota bacterium]|nr:glycine betaine ABC transporter substrate-binding protein [Candidatus Dormibacteraeota bacterium]
MKRIALAIMLTAWSAALTACGGGNGSSSSSAGGGGGSAACPVGSGTDGGGAKVSIGSKGFAEEQLLAEITKLELEKHNFTVDFSLQAKDTAIGQALSSGQIDMLWQYTGTELQTYLKLTTFPKDLDGAFTFVAQQDEPKGLCWTSKAPMNDTNGLAIKSSDRGKYGDTLSAFGTYLAAHSDTKVCIMSEFRTRPDGIPGLVQTYNAAFGAANLVDIGGTAEKNIANGDCAAGEVFTTDSPIAANNLYVLKDDKNLFPPDNVGLVIRSDVLKAHPAIAAIMAPVAAKITSDEITKLNKQVEIDNLKLEDVARTWLTQNGFL